MRMFCVFALALAGALVMTAMGSTLALAANPEIKARGGAGEFPLTFEGRTARGVTVRLITRAGKEVSCGGGATVRGSVIGAREATRIRIIAGECEDPAVRLECKNVAARTIEMQTLKAKPVFINARRAAREERGFDLFPEIAGPMARFECGTGVTATRITVENAVGAKNSMVAVIPASQVGAFRGEVEMALKQAHGVQEPTAYEEERNGTFETLEDFLEAEGTGFISFRREQAGLEAPEIRVQFRNKAGLEEAVEIT